MIVLLDNGQDADQCAEELGCEVGQLLTPLTRYRLRNPNAPWAIDNGAFAGLDVAAFRSLLAREAHQRELCRFVAVPDVVGSARRTLEVFEIWKRELARFDHFERLGANSCDGTGLARYSHMRKAIARRDDQPRLLDAGLHLLEGEGQ